MKFTETCTPKKNLTSMIVIQMMDPMRICPVLDRGTGDCSDSSFSEVDSDSDDDD